ncbi:glycosyltransferase family 2 protein [Desulfosarcina ovata]|uniref:glycosyltransferase family 2 protein n=1 Tax=Desulfosarcina ovata TaxID=83564 RepID=UPI00156680B7|nr:glycosyltransferase family 2 protein [Desulfosarcina ovata]
MISVVVAVLNNVNTLGACLQSVISQTYLQKELVVIDGGSTDGSLDIIEKHSPNISYWQSEPDAGVYDAWNKALVHTHGKWICFLGADDFFWNNRVLVNIQPWLYQAQKSGIRVVYGKAAWVNKKGDMLKTLGKPWRKVKWLMPHGMPIPHPGLMQHRDLFDEHGPFDLSFPIAGDYEFLLRELKRNDALFVEGLTVVGWRSGGMSDDHSIEAHKEVLDARRKNDIRGLSWVWCAVHARNIVRKYWWKWRRSLKARS